MKLITRKINKIFYENIAKPLRDKKDLILLLLETIKQFQVGEVSTTNHGKITVVVDKMSRVFYQIENKIFSLVFPFGIEITEEKYRIYDVETDMEIDSKVIAVLISIISYYDNQEISVETLLDGYCESVLEEENEYINALWSILIRLFSMESGYIRYDYDKEHEDEEYHPLNHFDVNYSSNITYKIGLKKMINLEEMINFLDTKQKCQYLEKI